jgi:cytochrome P450
VTTPRELIAALVDERQVGDPHAVWARLRDLGPVVEVSMPDGTSAHLVTRYDAVRAALTHPDLSGSARHAGENQYRGYDLPPALGSNIINSDGATHERLRSVITPAFAARRIDRLHTTLGRIVRDRLDLLGAPPRAELVGEFIGPVHADVVCAWLALPEPLQARYHAWSRALLDPTPRQAVRARDGLQTMAVFVADTIASKRRVPGDDLLSELIAAHRVGQLSDDELSSMVFYLLFVWYEVGTNFTATALHGLLARPGGLEPLRQDTGAGRRALEELLRHDPPQMITFRRYAVRPTRLSDLRIPAGASVVACLAAANRDPAAFPDPERLDIGRHGRPHLAFGYGSHMCPAPALARLQTRLVVEGLAQRFPAVRATQPPQAWPWRPGIRNRGPREVLVDLGDQHVAMRP